MNSPWVEFLTEDELRRWLDKYYEGLTGGTALASFAATAKLQTRDFIAFVVEQKKRGEHA